MILEKSFYLSKISLLSIFFKKLYLNNFIFKSLHFFNLSNYKFICTKKNKVKIDMTKREFFKKMNLKISKDDRVNKLSFTNSNKVSSLNFGSRKLQFTKIISLFFWSKAKTYYSNNILYNNFIKRLYVEHKIFIFYFNFKKKTTLFNVFYKKKKLKKTFYRRLLNLNLNTFNKDKLNLRIIKIPRLLVKLLKKKTIKKIYKKKIKYFFKKRNNNSYLNKIKFKKFIWLFKKKRVIVRSKKFRINLLLPTIMCFRRLKKARRKIKLSYNKIDSKFFKKAFIYNSRGFFQNLILLKTNPNNNIFTVNTLFKKSFIYTINSNSFIYNYNGINKLTRLYLTNIKYRRSYKIKKMFYSFLKINEYKKNIFDSKKKLILSKTIYFTKGIKFLFKDLILSSNNLIYYVKGQTCLNLFSTNNLIIDKLYYKTNFSSKSNINDTLEIRMPRVRFKPGYQRLWRNFRLALAESINFRFIYQQQLTTYLTKFFRKINQTYFSLNENKLDKIIIYSRLLPDKATFNLFFDNGLISLNNKTLSIKNLFIYKNDLIRLEISNWYYIFSRWMLSWVQKRQQKFKKLVFRKRSSSRYKIMKQVKQKSNYTPNWINTVVHDFIDVKPFLEVDFFTLSVFCIYDYNLFLYYTPEDIKVIRYNIYRLYNWKYIT